jgi:hypothetical protein
MEAIGRESMQNRGMLRWSEMAKADNLDSPAKVTFGTSIRVQIQLQIVADNSVISEHEILYFDKDDDRLEAIGLLLDAAKVVLSGTQDRLVTAQVASVLVRHWWG